MTQPQPPTLVPRPGDPPPEFQEPILNPVRTNTEMLVEGYLAELRNGVRIKAIQQGKQIITYVLTKWPKASDIQIRCDRPIRIQVGKDIEFLKEYLDEGQTSVTIDRLSPLTAVGCIIALFRSRVGARTEEIEAGAYAEEENNFLTRLGKTLKDDFSCKGETFLEGTLKVGRMRVHCFWDNKGVAATVRILYESIPKLEDLGYGGEMAKRLLALASTSSGFALVTGKTGHGKSTTLAALAATILAQDPKHILTIEDPIEYHLPDQDAHGEYLPGMVTQQEVGVEVRSFHEGIMTALRKHPNIVILGELRDIDSIRAALQCAETGHFVLATLHTCSAPETISRLISPFSTDEQRAILVQLSTTLRFVLSQALLPNAKDPKKKVLCYEFMANSTLKSQGAIVGYADSKGNGLDDWMMDKSNVRWDQQLGHLLENGDITQEVHDLNRHDQQDTSSGA